MMDIFCHTSWAIKSWAYVSPPFWTSSKSPFLPYLLQAIAEYSDLVLMPYIKLLPVDWFWDMEVFDMWKLVYWPISSPHSCNSHQVSCHSCFICFTHWPFASWIILKKVSDNGVISHLCIFIDANMLKLVSWMLLKLETACWGSIFL